MDLSAFSGHNLRACWLPPQRRPVPTNSSPRTGQARRGRRGPLPASRRPVCGWRVAASERSDRCPVNLPDMRFTRMLVFVAAAILAVTGASISATPTAALGSPPSSYRHFDDHGHAYKPIAAPGTTDDYHCTLVNPHVTRNE